MSTLRRVLQRSPANQPISQQQYQQQHHSACSIPSTVDCRLVLQERSPGFLSDLNTKHFTRGVQSRRPRNDATPRMRSLEVPPIAVV
ncbi:hypothetical protein PI125_g587 [Phytophthora idaei]|nr:hypothetical protein PI125_g587 [Phytophthora idaei]